MSGSSATQAQKATNVVYHDRDHCIGFDLPVVPEMKQRQTLRESYTRDASSFDFVSLLCALQINKLIMIVAVEFRLSK